MGRLSWAAILFYQPVVMIASGTVGFVIFCVLALVTVKGWWPYLWREWITSVDHKRIGVMSLGFGLFLFVCGVSVRRTLRSDLLRARHHHDLFRGHAVCHRTHELRLAATARRARCRLSRA